MGALIRAFDWSTTPLGPPETWPQSLRTTVSILLHSQFPMFLWWGDELIQFYNDAYRPSLGNEGKHPAVGQRGAACWSEIWPTIHPLIDQVRSGGPAIWSENQLIPIHRNGRLEDVYWTFGYSAVLDESSRIGGVLVVCQETTERVRALQQIESRQQELQTILEQAPVVLSIVGREPDFVYRMANASFAELVGRPLDAILGKPLLDVLPEVKGQGFDELLTQVATTGTPYVASEAPVSLVRNGKEESFFFDFLYHPMRGLDGEVMGVMSIVIDVTSQVLARQRIEESEAYLSRIFKHTAVAMAIFQGPNFIIEVANPRVCTLWDRTEAQVLGRPLFEALPEIAGQGFEELLTQVLETGQPFVGTEIPGTLHRNGRLDTVYFDFVYEPLPDADGRVNRILVTATDATERRQTRQQIEESQRQLQALFEQAPVGIAILRGPEHTFELANKLYVSLVGRKRSDEIVGKPLLEALPEIEGQGFDQLLTNVVETRVPLVAKEQPVQLVRNGQLETAYVDFVYQPLPAGESGVFAVVTDVTESALARQKIEESELRLQLALEASQSGVWELDLLNHTARTSRRYDQIFGYPDGLPAWSQGQIAAHVYEPDQALARACFDEALRTGTLHLVVRVVWPDESLHWIEAKGKVMYDSERQPVRMLGTVIDTTEQKKVETALRESDRWFRQLADSMPQMVWSTRPDGYHDFYNQRWYDFTGLDYERTRDQGWADLLHPDDYELTFQRWRHALETGELYETEYRMRQHDGRYCWLLARARPMYDEQGHIIKWFGTCTDIDEQKRQAERLEELVEERTRDLRESNQELERSNLDLMQFAYVASHDLKEPLRKIQMFGGLLERELKDRLSERAKQHLDVVTSSSSRMQLLVEDVLNLSRLSQRDVVREQVDLNRLVTGIVSDLEVLIREKEARIEVGPLPLIDAVRGQMHQLFQNLISNGLKFNESRTPVVTIRAVDFVPGEQVVVEVSDNGIGFAEEFREKMFGMFQRLNGRTYAGTGIGLTICRKIVENHRGTIEAFSTPGQGATFRVTLPT